MRYARSCWIILFLLPAAPAIGDDHAEHQSIVIDTDMGLDDAVTLALALQNPDLDIAAIVACEGVAGRDQGIAYLGRMLACFNRPDIPLYAAIAGTESHAAPPFRPFAEQAIGAALSDTTKCNHRPFSPEAYGAGRKQTVVALGPLTNVAAALAVKPSLKDGIEKLVLPGSPDPWENWNLAYDEPAWTAVRDSGIRLEFVIPAAELRKPPAWREAKQRIGQDTSLGETFVTRLLADSQCREHYVAHWPGFADELALLYCIRPDLFARPSEADSTTQPARRAFAPRDGRALVELFTRCLSEGRQHKDRVVIADRLWPEDLLQPDLRARASAIIAKNGDTEWFSQLLASEMHDHLGAYSIIGAKMGLRAAELLNAPLHAMKVTSHSAGEPPVSCLNDGVIVATGSTPGRALFAHLPGAAGSTEVTFSYNGREVILAVKPEYDRKIAAEVGRLRKEYGLSRHEYWDGVRRLALDIWENWHRRDLFTVESKPAGS